ncbi:glycogen debranching enzyme GlgX [Oerskovia sp. M15]
MGPAAGLRYNPAKLLLDPYARGLVGELDQDPSTRGHVTARDDAGTLRGDPRGPADPATPRRTCRTRSSSPHARAPARAPPARAVGRHGPLRGPRPRSDPAARSRPGGPARHLRGPRAPRHDRAPQDLGVTTVELLPIHAFLSEPHLVAKGLTNYWGYSTAASSPRTRPTRRAPRGRLAPVPWSTRSAAWSTCCTRPGSRSCSTSSTTTRARAGSTARTCRGAASTTRSTTCTTARPRPSSRTSPGRGTASTSAVLAWSRRLSTRCATGRRRSGSTGSASTWPSRWDAVPAGSTRPPFLVALQTDPVLGALKLIAEPWDVGPGGWRTGQFPPPMAEWNDRFRGAVRQFWLADPARRRTGAPPGVRELATRLAGSADLFGHSDPPLMRGLSLRSTSSRPTTGSRSPTSWPTSTSTTRPTARTTVTAATTTAPGTTASRVAWRTRRPRSRGAFEPGLEIAPLRRRSIRNLMATQVLAAGTPMLTAGDEMGRTQRGNNNAYCQDGPLSWVSWDLSPWRKDLLATTTHLLALRREHAVLRSDTFFHGRPRHAAEDAVPDLEWFDGAGHTLDQGAWHDPGFRVLQMLRTGPREGDRDVLVVVNGALDAVELTLAGVPGRGSAVTAGAGDDPSTGSTDGPTQGVTWELAWDSDWEHPTEGDEVVPERHRAARTPQHAGLPLGTLTRHPAAVPHGRGLAAGQRACHKARVRDSRLGACPLPRGRVPGLVSAHERQRRQRRHRAGPPAPAPRAVPGRPRPMRPT